MKNDKVEHVQASFIPSILAEHPKPSTLADAPFIVVSIEVVRRFTATVTSMSDLPRIMNSLKLDGAAETRVLRDMNAGDQSRVDSYITVDELLRAGFIEEEK